MVLNSASHVYLCQGRKAEGEQKAYSDHIRKDITEIIIIRRCIVSAIRTLVEELDHLIESYPRACKCRDGFPTKSSEPGYRIRFCHVGEEHGEVVGIRLFWILYGPSYQLAISQQILNVQRRTDIRSAATGWIRGRHRLQPAA